MKTGIGSIKIALLLVILTGALSSCISLKSVNEFSSSSLKSIKLFEEIPYSFTQNCLDNCYDDKIRQRSFDSVICPCKTYRKADSVTLLIYKSVKGYFDGLTNLSKNDLTSYKMNSVNKALTTADYGSVKIEKAQAEAYSDLFNILLGAATDRYRQCKIKKFIKKGNAPLKVLIRFLDFNLSDNLNGTLDVKKRSITSDYFDLKEDSTLSTYEKMKVVEEYYQKLDQLEAIQKKLNTYSKALRKIKDGHQALVDHSGKLSKSEVKEQLLQYASDIQDIITDYNKISK